MANELNEEHNAAHELARPVPSMMLSPNAIMPGVVTGEARDPG